MKVIEGHLTATNKTHVKAILFAKMNRAKVNSIVYSLNLENGVYTVTIEKKDRGLVPVPGSPFRISKSKAKFIV